MLNNKLLEETTKIDQVFSKFKTHSIKKTNELFYAGAAVVTNRLGVKIDKVAGRNEQMWKRLQNKIKKLRKDLSQLEASKDKDISNFRHLERLERKYSIRVKRPNVAIEKLNQRITAIAAKVKSYQGRVDGYRQDRIFENNQRQFYRELDQEEERFDDAQPVADIYIYIYIYTDLILILTLILSNLSMYLSIYLYNVNLSGRSFSYFRPPYQYMCRTP